MSEGLAAPTDTRGRPIIIHRSFQRDFIEPLARMPDISVTAIANLDYGIHRYPLYTVLSPNPYKPNNPTVLISGGVHGDEPAGSLTSIDFLKGPIHGYTNQCNFVVLPCVNPSGYERDHLKTMSNANLNRLFGIGSAQPEIAAIEAWLKHAKIRFDMTLDLHECSPFYEGEFNEEDGCSDAVYPDGCWMWESQKDINHRIGRCLIDTLPTDTKVCDWPEILGDKADKGIIWYPEGCMNPDHPIVHQSFDGFLNRNYTDHSFTLETITTWPLKKRIATHMIWIKTAIESLLSKT